MRADQLLIAITIAPTTAIRAHNNSLSPQRFNRLRMTGPPSILRLSKEAARQMPAWESCFFRFFWECEEAGSSDSAQVALSENVLGQSRFQPSAAIDPPASNI
jgi:hypothetical protein